MATQTKWDDGDPNERARLAYQQRSKQMADGWKRPKPAKAGPWGAVPMSRPLEQPAWTRPDGTTPSVGPSGTRSPYRGQHQDAREAAWQRMCDRLSTAYLKNRRPAVPGDQA